MDRLAICILLAVTGGVFGSGCGSPRPQGPLSRTERIEASCAALRPVIEEWTPWHQGDEVKIDVPPDSPHRSEMDEVQRRLGIMPAKGSYMPASLELRIEDVLRSKSGDYLVRFRRMDLVQDAAGIGDFETDVAESSGVWRVLEQRSKGGAGGIADYVGGIPKPPTPPLLNGRVPSRAHVEEAILRAEYLPRRKRDGTPRIIVAREGGEMPREEDTFLMRRIDAFSTGFNPDERTMRIAFAMGWALGLGRYEMEAEVRMSDAPGFRAKYVVQTGESAPKIESKRVLATLPPGLGD